MNDSGKSDIRIVPKKEPNKAGSKSTALSRRELEDLVAEALEGKGMTKGNTSPVYRLRTQRRELLQQAHGASTSSG